MVRKLVAALLFSGLVMMPLQVVAQSSGAKVPRSVINASGFPLPRFVSLSFDKVNVRAGPGVNYPLQWTYTRRKLPVKVIREYDNWRQVIDVDGDEGWIHKSQLTGRRTGLVQPGVHQVMSDPGPDGLLEFTVEGGVILRLHACVGAWCVIQVGEREGHLPRAAIWGTLKGEHFD